MEDIRDRIEGAGFWAQTFGPAGFKKSHTVAGGWAADYDGATITVYYRNPGYVVTIFTWGRAGGELERLYFQTIDEAWAGFVAWRITEGTAEP